MPAQAVRKMHCRHSMILLSSVNAKIWYFVTVFLGWEKSRLVDDQVDLGCKT